MQFNCMLSIGRVAAMHKPIRSFNTSSKCNLIQTWRKERGLPLNPNTCGILTDKPDYTYLDGRLTPMGVRQKNRMAKQEGIADKIMQLTSEVDFAVGRHKQVQIEQQNHRDNIIRNKLKPKGKLSL